jgi:hypothetical protein
MGHCICTQNPKAKVVNCKARKSVIEIRMSMQNTIVEKFSKIKHDYIISHDFLGKGTLNI